MTLAACGMSLAGHGQTVDHTAEYLLALARLASRLASRLAIIYLALDYLALDYLA